MGELVRWGSGEGRVEDVGVGGVGMDMRFGLGGLAVEEYEACGFSGVVDGMYTF